jgi:hypothetical protein
MKAILIPRSIMAEIQPFIDSIQKFYDPHNAPGTGTGADSRTQNYHFLQLYLSEPKKVEYLYFQRPDRSQVDIRSSSDSLVPAPKVRQVRPLRRYGLARKK